jgi:hypothetical protein
MSNRKNNDYLRNLAALEQAAAGLKTIASILFSYYKSLVETGFNPKDAFRLVKSYQDKLISTGIEMIENDFINDEEIDDLDDYNTEDGEDENEYPTN